MPCGDIISQTEQQACHIRVLRSVVEEEEEYLEYQMFFVRPVGEQKPVMRDPPENWQFRVNN